MTADHTLYDNPASPYCRKVRLVIHEAGLGDRVTLERSEGNPVNPGTMPVGVNPLGKIPCLVRPGGPALYDSRVIAAYLDDLGGGTLMPDGPSRFDAMTLEATADGMLDAAILTVYEGRVRPPELQFAPWVEGQRAKITRALDVLEARWMPSPAGRLDIGHLALASALGYLEFRNVMSWRETHPDLAKWFVAISDRPSMQATVPS